MAVFPFFIDHTHEAKCPSCGSILLWDDAYYDTKLKKHICGICKAKLGK